MRAQRETLGCSRSSGQGIYSLTGFEGLANFKIDWGEGAGNHEKAY